MVMNNLLYVSNNSGVIKGEYYRLLKINKIQIRLFFMQKYKKNL